MGAVSVVDFESVVCCFWFGKRTGAMQVACTR
jgi:hypothetical protein